jgi:Putative DNA-binding domain
LNPRTLPLRSADEFELAALQSLLYRLITAPASIEEAAAHERALQTRGLEAVIAGNERLSASDRLRIYANAYFYRLLDIFKEDFPCTYTVLGDVNFHNLITGYLIEYPPNEPSVLYAGHHLPHYLETISGPARVAAAHVPFLADLARLERACIEVFHGADAEALEQKSLSGLPPESWPMLRIRLHPAAQIFDIEWRIDVLMAAIKEGRQWELPERSSARLLVWRKQQRVHYRALEPGERAALKTATGGADFSSICTSLASELESAAGVTDLAGIINRMLTGWLNDGILTRENA